MDISRHVPKPIFSQKKMMELLRGDDGIGQWMRKFLAEEDANRRIATLQSLKKLCWANALSEKVLHILEAV